MKTTKPSTAPVKVAYLLTPIDFGGSDKVSLMFLKNVTRNRYDITPILLTRPWEQECVFSRMIKAEGYSVLNIPVAKKSGTDPLRVPRSFKALYDFLKSNSFGMLHTHGYFADIIGIPAARALSIPVVSTCHGYINTDKKLGIYNALDRKVLRLADKVIAVSEGIRDELIGAGIKPSRVVVLVNAVESGLDSAELIRRRAEARNKLKIEEGTLVVGYIGRLSEEKGVRYLIEAASILKESVKGLKVLIIGTGREDGQLHKLVEELKLKDIVYFAGFQRDIGEWLPAMDIFALPSLTEGTPMALLEAMSYGLPVVATRVGGVPSVIENGNNGILVEPKAPGELADAIMDLYWDKNSMKRLSTLGKKTIKSQYDMKCWTLRIEEIYSGFTIKSRPGGTR